MVCPIVCVSAELEAAADERVSDEPIVCVVREAIAAAAEKICSRLVATRVIRKRLRERSWESEREHATQRVTHIGRHRSVGSAHTARLPEGVPLHRVNAPTLDAGEHLTGGVI